MIQNKTINLASILYEVEQTGAKKCPPGLCWHFNNITFFCSLPPSLISPAPCSSFLFAQMFSTLALILSTYNYISHGTFSQLLKSFIFVKKKRKRENYSSNKMYLNAFKVSYMIKTKAQIHTIILAWIRSSCYRVTKPLKYT